MKIQTCGTDIYLHNTDDLKQTREKIEYSKEINNLLTIIDKITKEKEVINIEIQKIDEYYIAKIKYFKI